jgi:hypothetical protein
MPGVNGGGPRGQGSDTGWGRGPCGAGLRRGFGCRGGGFGRRDYDSPKAGSALSARGTTYASRLDETEASPDEKAYLEGELAAIQKRLAELDRQA